MNPTLTTQLQNLPDAPGIYQFKDSQGRLLYVGKAKSLRPRVQSYFRPAAALDESKRQMVSNIASLEIITTDTETEALILEANLIRAHQPPYNVILRDDKYYLFIKITKEPLPRVFPVRRLKNDGARYFGPYSSARSVRNTLKLLRRIFPFRSEKDSPQDIIFPHPLFNSSQTPGSDTKTYHQNIQHIIRFLLGQRHTILSTLEEGMRQASQTQDFERAKLFHDQIQAIARLEGHQKVHLPHPESFDVISLAQGPLQSAANLFQLRRGRLLGKQTFLLKHKVSSHQTDILRQFILQYYSVAQDIPKNILIPFNIADSSTLATWIKNKTGHITEFITPKRGPKKQLITMGVANAAHLLSEQAIKNQSPVRALEAHQALMAAIGLPPDHIHRVEIYDISNIQGQLATASMAVFVDGLPNPKLYRKFRIKLGDTPNDFAMLQETLTRRLQNHHTDWPKPDLIIIDGGKGQLSATYKVIQALAPSIPIISLAKREEEIFLPEQKESIRLPFDSPALELIQRMRDEAHRFTITYHRLLRSKHSQRSLLDEVPGIGPKTKQKLIKHFGSLKNIRLASDQDIAKIIGQDKTATLRDYL